MTGTRTALGALALALLALGQPMAEPARAQSFLEGEFDPAVPTLNDTVGHAPGERITSPDEAMAYLEALAEAAPDRIRLVEYARSWEGRPLVYAVLTAPSNMARLDAIRADLATIAAGRPGNGAAIPVTWLAYSVHGNEVSSTDAALMTAYHLLAAEDDPRAQAILSETVLVIDPLQNPDGRARFVNRFRASRGIEPAADRQAAEHDEPWPSGRVNHYMFDLNRDWFTLSQPETRGKVAAIREWNPVVVVDLHEMGGDETYFFSPAAEPVNPNITAAQQRAYDIIGRNNARHFDAMGEPFFTREVYDLFYPGYGDTWNTHQGAIGSTYEQGSARGLVFERRDGTELTYADGVRNHFVASLSTAEAVAENADRFLADFARYRAANAEGAAGRGAYVIDLGERRWNAEALGRRLAAQGITVLRREGPASACGRTYRAGYLAVPQAQPAARLAKSLLDRDTPLPESFLAQQERRRAQDLPHELYDVTAWSVGLMSGVDVALCGAAAGDPLAPDAPIAPLAEGSGRFAVAVPWTDSGQARLVTLALRAGLEARVTDEAFTKDGREYPRGTVVFPALANDPAKMERLSELAREVGAHTVALESSWVEEGPNLGSESFARLTLPRVAMAWDEGISQLSAGAMRYVLERRLGLPVVPIRTDRFAGADLADYDVLIVPDGDPAGRLGRRGLATIRSFVTRGGVLVAVGDSLAAFSEGDRPLLALEREAALGRDPDAAQADGEDEGGLVEGREIASEEDYREAIRDQLALPDTLPGALVNTVPDPEHFLSAGHDEGAVVLASGSLIYTPLDRGTGTNVLHYAPADSLVASGYVWEENRRQLAFKPYLVAQETGDGLAIGFAQDPSTRAYLDGLDLLIANAVLVAPSRVR
ncbi:M14 family metallopeptidase [Erythrobacter sp. HL-111]|uniref:M14 family metallopeptidase n=1 Tax=Erythrobacter sp. HL-111 TaxID=1798193 RepID=UPI0006DB0504|nr:M14 family metallopeptidase [Erythrobacter sp. HL-111]KPP95416.1 MAG: Zinc carboxypeptidase [Erythrobacteraceae bacterium HL-111]SDS69428.1 Zinc carboxypeptidase [Erythrobacter sp. HL-111]